MIDDLLSAYLDGELDDEERKAVENELAASPTLRRELAELDADLAALLARFGTRASGPDLNADGLVDMLDLMVLLENWNS